MKKRYTIPVTDVVRVTLHRGVLDVQVGVTGGSKESTFEMAAEGKEQSDFGADGSWGNLWED